MQLLKVLLVVFSLFFLCVSAQPGANFADLLVEEEVKPEPSVDVATASAFPRFSSRKFLAGEPVEILVGFRNKGNSPFNVTLIHASFNYPLDYSYYIQNFTAIEYGTFVAAQEEATFSYFFRPDPMLEPRDFGLVVSVFYQDVNKKNYTNVVFNSTVEMVEASGGLDAQGFFAILAVVAVVGLVGFVLFRTLGTWSKRQGGGKISGVGKVSAAARQKEDEDDWLVGTSADPSLRKVQKRKKGDKKSSR